MKSMKEGNKNFLIESFRKTKNKKIESEIVKDFFGVQRKNQSNMKEKGEVCSFNSISIQFEYHNSE